MTTYMKPEALVRSVMSLYEGAKIIMRWNLSCQMSSRFSGDAPMICAVAFSLAVVVDVDTELTGECVLSELMYADDIDLMSETIEGLRNMFIKWKEAFQSKVLEVKLGKTKVMVTGGITKDDMSKSKVEPCDVCSMRAKANSVVHQ